MALPSVVIQNATYTALRLGFPLSITYVNGGTAGSEVVTMDSAYNIFIQIQAGTSTNTQIIAALNATKGTSLNSLAPGDLVVGTTSSGSTTPLCFSLVPLAGGNAIASAVLSLGPLVVTAVTGGTGGNSIRLKFAAGMSASVGVSSNDITVTVVEGTTSFGNVMDLINADMAASALVAVTSTRGAYAAPTYSALGAPTSNDPNLVFASTLPAFTNLAGGLAAAAATSGAIQGVTVAETATGGLKNGVLVTLTPGATAGAEVVSFVGGNIFCQIQSGTSTPTQIAAALNGNGTFSATYTASHSGSTGVLAVYENLLTGGSGPVNPGSTSWYSDSAATVLTASFVYFPFGGMAQNFHAENDDASGSNTVIGSWDGINNAFIIAATKQLDLDKVNRPGVYLKYGTGAPAYKALTVNR